MKCAGAAYMSKSYDKGSNPAAAEGTAVHEIAETILTGGEVLAGSLASNGVIITADMIEAALFYVQGIRQLCLSNVQYEQRLFCRGVHPECFGTADTVGIKGIDTIVICDLKHGFRQVDPFENWQLITYANGALERLPNATFFEFYIFQTRPSPTVRKWKVRVEHLKMFWEELKVSAANATCEGSPTLTAGQQCRDCKGRHLCPALKESALFAVEMAYEYVDSDTIGLAKELKVLLKGRDAINYRITGIEAELTSVIKSGKPVPGFVLNRVEGNMAWDIPIEDVVSLGEIEGIDLKKDGVLTPTQAINKGLPREYTKNYASRPLKEFKLEILDEKQIRKNFGEK